MQKKTGSFKFSLNRKFFCKLLGTNYQTPQNMFKLDQKLPMKPRVHAGLVDRYQISVICLFAQHHGCCGECLRCSITNSISTACMCYASFLVKRIFHPLNYKNVTRWLLSDTSILRFTRQNPIPKWNYADTEYFCIFRFDFNTYRKLHFQRVRKAMRNFLFECACFSVPVFGAFLKARDWIFLYV